MTTQELAQGIRLVAGHGGLAAVEVTTPAGSGASTTALIYLHGAHVADWTPAGGKPVLWMSKFGVFSETDPLRGGVPLCFPWFGPNGTDASAPNHGWARLSTWSLVDSRTVDTATGAAATEIVFELTQDSVGVPA